MSSFINPSSDNPTTSERLPSESARAYRAFCFYRDLGPNRSLDRAWKHFHAEQGKDSTSARRPGYWTDWSTKNNWVERAQAHDDAMDADKRRAAAETRQKLCEMREQFAIEAQDRAQERVRRLDSTMERMAAAPLSEVTQVKYDRVTRIKTTTKVKPLDGPALAAVSKSANETTSQATRDVDPKHH